jgi:hypothetical protein
MTERLGDYLNRVTANIPGANSEGAWTTSIARDWIEGAGSVQVDSSIGEYNFRPNDPHGVGETYMSEFRYGSWVGGGYGARGFTRDGIPITQEERVMPVKDLFDAMGRRHDLGADDAFTGTIGRLGAEETLDDRVKAFKDYYRAMEINDDNFVRAVEWAQSGGFVPGMSRSLAVPH